VNKVGNEVHGVKTGRGICKEMPVIPVNKVVDPKRIIRKNDGWGGGEAQGVADPKKLCRNETFFLFFIFCRKLSH
jgi:hypothetical protein